MSKNHDKDTVGEQGKNSIQEILNILNAPETSAGRLWSKILFGQTKKDDDWVRENKRPGQLLVYKNKTSIKLSSQETIAVYEMVKENLEMFSLWKKMEIVQDLKKHNSNIKAEQIIALREDLDKKDKEQLEEIIEMLNRDKKS